MSQLPINAYDILFVCYVVWGWYRGQKRQFVVELKALIELALFICFLLGLSLFGYFKQAIETFIEFTQITQSDFFRWVFAVCGGFYFIYFIRHRFAHAVDEELKDENKTRGGGYLGVLRHFLVCVMITLLCYFPLNLFNSAISESWLGSSITSFYSRFDLEKHSSLTPNNESLSQTIKDEKTQDTEVIDEETDMGDIDFIYQ